MLIRLLFLTLLALPASAQSWDGLDARIATPEAAAPAFLGAVTYAYDDGAANVNIGPPSTFDPDMLWGNYFLTESGGEVITAIEVAFGSTFPSGGPVTFWLLDDPDADGDPRNATALTSVQAEPDVFGNTFFRVEIAPTRVSGAFFVGASAQLAGGQDRPARVDTGARADRSWFFYDPSIAAVIDDLATAAFGTRMDDPTHVPFPGAFMVRATGQEITTAADDAPSAREPRLRVSPNPSAGPLLVTLDLARPGPVTVDVLDLLGRIVATVHDGALPAGAQTVAAREALAPGTYVVRAKTENGTSVARVVVAGQ